MMSGLEKVTRNAVMPLCQSVPFCLLLMCMFLVGLALNEMMPKMSRMMLPSIWSMNFVSALFTKSITNDMPKPVIMA